METLFWLEESVGDIDLFSFKTANDKEPWKYDATFNKYDADRLIREVPIGITINNRNINLYLEEWLQRKQELQNGEITQEEYFEWKINWPESCDDCGKIIPAYKWRRKDP